jgi:hypothetical protein
VDRPPDSSRSLVLESDRIRRRCQKIARLTRCGNGQRTVSSHDSDGLAEQDRRGERLTTSCRLRPSAFSEIRKQTFASGFYGERHKLVAPQTIPPINPVNMPATTPPKNPMMTSTFPPKTANPQYRPARAPNVPPSFTPRSHAAMNRLRFGQLP